MEDMTPEILRDKLQLAVKNKDRAKLEQLIEIAEEAKYPELSFDLCDAREALKTLGGGFGG